MTNTHRIRRGKLVEIPEEWRGHVTTPKTIRDRKERAICKKKKRRAALRKDKELALKWNAEETNGTQGQNNHN